MPVVRRVCHSLAEAESAREAIRKAGIPAASIAISRPSTEDGIAGEVPGQSYENQPGQKEHDFDRDAARFGSLVRGKACVLTVSSDPAPLCGRLTPRGAPPALRALDAENQERGEHGQQRHGERFAERRPLP